LILWDHFLVDWVKWHLLSTFSSVSKVSSGLF
jgi:uncharacterized membrane protein